MIGLYVQICKEPKATTNHIKKLYTVANLLSRVIFQNSLSVLKMDSTRNIDCRLQRWQ